MENTELRSIEERAPGDERIAGSKTNLQGLRPISLDDVEAMEALLHACQQADRADSVPTAKELSYQFQMPGIDVTQHLFVLPDASGALIGIAGGVPIPSIEQYLIGMQITVHPAYRDGTLQDDLLQFVEVHAADWQARTGHTAVMQASARADQQNYIDLFTRHGYQVVRYFLKLERDLMQPIPEFPVPEGIRIRPITLDNDLEAVYHTIHDSFQDHFNPPQFTKEQMRHWAASPDFRPDLILLALEVTRDPGGAVTEKQETEGNMTEETETDEKETEGEAAGISLNMLRDAYNREHNAREGEVGTLGVRRPFRRRGLARALLTRSLHLLKDQGMTTAVLSVDAENPLGATRLYASVGFTERRRSLVFAKSICSES